MENITTGRGYVYSIKYHLVWCIKYRAKILNGLIDEDLKQILSVIAKENTVQIITMETNQDHIHLLVSCSPQHFIPNIIKAFKGVGARRLFDKHPELQKTLWGGHLWNPSYFVATVSDNTQQQIEDYINKQKIQK